jgi:hypothetical protein
MKIVGTLAVISVVVAFSGCSCDLEGIKCTEDKHCPSDMRCNTAEGVCEKGAPSDRDAGVTDVGGTPADGGGGVDVGEQRRDGSEGDVPSAPDAGADSGPDVGIDAGVDGGIDTGVDAGCQWGVPEDGIGCCDNRYANNCTGCRSYCAHDGEPIRCICDFDGGLPDVGPELDAGTDSGGVPDGGKSCDANCNNAWPNTEGACDYSTGTCTFKCRFGWSNCNLAIEPDGCEVDIINDINNCGMCGDACATNHVSPECKNMTCGGLCDQEHLDCNEDLPMIGSDGCEVDKTSDPNNCGACDRSVTGLPHVLSATCAAQEFTNIICEEGYWNVTPSADDGCEYGPCTKNAATGGLEVCNGVDDDCNGTPDDGTLAAVCPARDHATPNACMGVPGCSYVCENDYGDCDNLMGTNGCETNIKTSLTYCGSCGLGHGCFIANGTPVCEDGVCKPSACNSGYKIDVLVCTKCDSTASCGSDCGACSTDPNGLPACAGNTNPAATSCSLTCNGGFWNNAGVCTACSVVNHCGSDCQACATDPNGTPACAGNSQPAAASCSITCATGFWKDVAGCAACTTLAHCGTDCGSCPTDPNGTPACAGNTQPAATSCSLTCNAGYWKNGATCDTCNTTTKCGSDCQACPTDPNGTPACAGNSNPAATSCSIACNGGYHICGGVCVPDGGNIIVNGDFSSGMTGWTAENVSTQYGGCPAVSTSASVVSGHLELFGQYAYAQEKVSQSFNAVYPLKLSADITMSGTCGGYGIWLNRPNADLVLWFGGSRDGGNGIDVVDYTTLSQVPGASCHFTNGCSNFISPNPCNADYVCDQRSSSGCYKPGCTASGLPAHVEFTFDHVAKTATIEVNDVQISQQTFNTLDEILSSTVAFDVQHSCCDGRNSNTVTVDNVVLTGTCPAGSYPDAGGCQTCNTVTKCGSDCQACPTDPNGTPACAGNSQPAATSCSLTCNDGYHLSGGVCVSNGLLFADEFSDYSGWQDGAGMPCTMNEPGSSFSISDGWLSASTYVSGSGSCSGYKYVTKVKPLATPILPSDDFRLEAWYDSGPDTAGEHISANVGLVDNDGNIVCDFQWEDSQWASGYGGVWACSKDCNSGSGLVYTNDASGLGTSNPTFNDKLAIERVNGVWTFYLGDAQTGSPLNLPSTVTATNIWVMFACNSPSCRQTKLDYVKVERLRRNDDLESSAAGYGCGYWTAYGGGGCDQWCNVIDPWRDTTAYDPLLAGAGKTYYMGLCDASDGWITTRKFYCGPGVTFDLYTKPMSWTGKVELCNDTKSDCREVDTIPSGSNVWSKAAKSYSPDPGYNWSVSDACYLKISYAGTRCCNTDAKYATIDNLTAAFAP